MINLPLAAVQATGDTSSFIKGICPNITKRRSKTEPRTDMYSLRTINEELGDLYTEVSGTGRLHLRRASFTLILVGL